MNKLLHERLREYAENKRMLGFKCERCDVIGLGTSEALALAEEIEKYYIPRPRFEDGEPLRLGDEVEDGTIHEIAFWDDGTIILLDETPETIYEVSAGCFIKRPESKVLDADGVEIKVGDTVWIIESGAKGKVEESKKDRAYIKCDDGWLADVHVSNLTHREPDSLEKLRDDLRDLIPFIPADEFTVNASDLISITNRLTAIMERDA